MTSAAKFLGEQRLELQHPSSNRFIGDVQPALGEQILDIAEAQGEAKVQPHRVSDDVGGNRWRANAIVIIIAADPERAKVSRVSSVGPARRAAQHHLDPVAGEMSGAQSAGKRLAVPARQLALKPNLQILPRRRRPLLRGLEQARRSTLADHVYRLRNWGPWQLSPLPRAGQWQTKRDAAELQRSNRHVVVDVYKTNLSASSQAGRLCPKKRPRSVSPPASHSEPRRPYTIAIKLTTGVVASRHMVEAEVVENQRLRNLRRNSIRQGHGIQLVHPGSKYVCPSGIFLFKPTLEAYP
jgi:hypothetical protein